MANRYISILLMVLFAFFLYLHLKDALGLVEKGQYGEIPILLLCASACVGWIAFLAALARASVPEHEANLQEWHNPLSRA